MDKFGTYEIFAIVTPGLCLLIGIDCFIGFCATEHLLVFKDISVGGFGIGIVIAYVTGQEIQVIGKLFAKFWWKFRVSPSARLQGKKLLFTKTHCLDIISRFQYIDIDPNQSIDWDFVRKRIVAMLPEKQNGRLYMFNSQYGMCRGLVVVFALFFIMCIFLPLPFWGVIISCICAILFVIGALIRMENFAEHYAKELYTTFLDTVEKTYKEPIDA